MSFIHWLIDPRTLNIRGSRGIHRFVDPRGIHESTNRNQKSRLGSSPIETRSLTNRNQKSRAGINIEKANQHMPKTLPMVTTSWQRPCSEDLENTICRTWDLLWTKWGRRRCRYQTTEQICDGSQSWLHQISDKLIDICLGTPGMKSTKFSKTRKLVRLYPREMENWKRDRRHQLYSGFGRKP